MIYENVEIGKNSSIGEYVVIEKGVIIGDNVTIGHHVVIKEDTVIGDNVKIGSLISLGKRPTTNKKMARKPVSTLAPLKIGHNVTIGDHVVLYRGVMLADDVYIGDLASIREKTIVGEASIVGRSATVENNTVIGKRVTIQTGSYVTADMMIEDDVFIGPCVSSSNDKYMGEGNYRHQGPIIKKGAKIGNNVTLLPGVEIGEEAVVGAGAVVTKRIHSNTTCVGNPAQPLRK
ncbi:N-acetyltransferase [Salipaludibacillus agaradhaerens]|uniref:N-acetyltransferase n=1 Tax=Salipaludibacillus agaradhaerens TaxID=76935 RepID=UPI000996229A|nr:N-acetyltransferase [Salipaludibacillus agaradhaerens]